MKQVQETITGVIVVENTGAKGLSGARNSSIAVAKSQILAFLDDDAIAIPNWLKFLTEGFTNPEALGIVGSATPMWLDHKSAWFPEESYWVVGCTYRDMPKTTASVRNLIGSRMSFRREVFQRRMGGFRSEVGCVGIRPMGCEETELCIRARQYWPWGIFLYQPQASVFHRVHGSRTH